MERAQLDSIIRELCRTGSCGEDAGAGNIFTGKLNTFVESLRDSTVEFPPPLTFQIIAI